MGRKRIGIHAVQFFHVPDVDDVALCLRAHDVEYLVRPVRIDDRAIVFSVLEQPVHLAENVARADHGIRRSPLEAMDQKANPLGDRSDREPCEAPRHRSASHDQCAGGRAARQHGDAMSCLLQ